MNDRRWLQLTIIVVCFMATACSNLRARCEAEYPASPVVKTDTSP